MDVITYSLILNWNRCCLKYKWIYLQFDLSQSVCNNRCSVRFGLLDGLHIKYSIVRQHSEELHCLLYAHWIKGHQKPVYWSIQNNHWAVMLDGLNMMILDFMPNFIFFDIFHWYFNGLLSPKMHCSDGEQGCLNLPQ